MKRILILLFCWLLINQCLAQKETYEFVSFTPPQGWTKDVKPNTSTSYTITNKKKNSYCQINIMLSVDSKGGINEDFESEWQGLIVKSFKVTDSAQVIADTSENGWTVKAGMAQFVFNNQKAVAMLTTMSGYNKTVSIVTVTNSQDYISSIQSFLGSVEMKVPDTSSHVINQNNSEGLSIIGTWGIGLSTSERYEDNKNAYAVNNYGFIRKQYTFNDDGTYSFYSKTFKMVYDKLLLVRESGTYRISGNQITISPTKSTIEAWSKKDNTDKWGKLLTKENGKLEKVTYQFLKHYFTGIQQWNLVLQYASPTERDGPFSTAAAFEKSWLYAPISPNNPVIDLPEGNQTSSAAKPKEAIQSNTTNAFAFTTTTFNDGWVAAEQADWVQVTKRNTKVLIHYPNKNLSGNYADVLEGLKNAWNVLVAPRYTQVNVEFKSVFGWQAIAFAETEAIEKATGKKVHLVLFRPPASESGTNYIEIIAADKKSFELEFGSNHESASGCEKMQKMSGYNKFAVAVSDLKGKWTNKFGGLTQYVNVYTGADAGATSYSSVQNFEIGPGNEYNWEIKVASGVVGNLKFQGAKSKGKFTIQNTWQINFSDIEGKPRLYDTYFSCIKGTRILWIDGTAYGKVE